MQYAKNIYDIDMISSRQLTTTELRVRCRGLRRCAADSLSLMKDELSTHDRTILDMATIPTTEYYRAKYVVKE